MQEPPHFPDLETSASVPTPLRPLEQRIQGIVRSAISQNHVYDAVCNTGKYVIEEGKDKEYRSALVGDVQGSHEATFAAVLGAKELESAVGVVHTPLPCTPCRTDGKYTIGLLHPDVENDPAQKKTVLTRANSVRDFLRAGGTLILMYSMQELSDAQERYKTHAEGPQVSPESMDFLKKLQNEYPDNLIVRPIDDRGSPALFPGGRSGATFICNGGQKYAGQKYGFSIEMPQAQRPNDGRKGIHAGDLQRDVVRNYTQGIGAFLGSYGTKEILQAIDTPAHEGERASIVSGTQPEAPQKSFLSGVLRVIKTVFPCCGDRGTHARNPSKGIRPQGASAHHMPAATSNERTPLIASGVPTR